VADVACVVGHAPCLEPSSDHGYLITEAEIVFWGLCPACQDAAAPAPFIDRPTMTGLSGQPGQTQPIAPSHP
jgi:Fur family ferric uptake transcriptional regulator